MRTTDRYVFFYTKDDCFSNFHPANFVVDGIQYSCSEQYMMYKKAKLFGDEEIADKILKEEKPNKIKALGRKASGFDQQKWEQNREIIVFEGNLAKFTQNEDLKKQIIDTYPRELVEASPSDNIWGVGLSIDDARIDDAKNWRGLNLLGKVLTQVRDKIINEKL